MSPFRRPGLFLVSCLCGLAATLPAEDYSLGVILSLTGAGSLDSKEDLEGVLLAVDEINAAGGLLKKHPIKLTIKDDQCKADIAAAQAKALLAEAQPRAVIGPWSSGCLLAFKPIFHEAKVLMISGQANSEDVTKLNPSPYFYSVVPNTYMMAKAIAVGLAKMAKDKGWKSYSTLVSDYAFGRTFQGNFVASMKALAPHLELKLERWPKQGEGEWGSHMAALAGSAPDFIFNGLVGDDLRRFTAAAGAVKFSEKFPCPGAAMPVNVLQDQKDNIELGYIGHSRCLPFAHLDQPMMKRLIEVYKAKHNGRFPTDWAMMHYDAVFAIKQAVEKANSIETEAVKDALKGATIETTRGPLAFRTIDNQLECAMYLGTISKDPTYSFPIYKDIQVLAAKDIMRPEAEIEAARQAAKK